jgi:hypothetical protein
MSTKVMITRRAIEVALICAVVGFPRPVPVRTSPGGQPLSPADSIPAFIIEKGMELIASRLGEEFCQQNIRFDPLRSQAHPGLPGFRPDFALRHPDLAQEPRYRLIFDLLVRRQPWARSEIEFFLDTRGDLLPDTKVVGLPDCRSNPARCQFPIDRQRAMDLAKAAGLEPGLRPWEVSFEWLQGDTTDAMSGVYAWTVTNTMFASELEDRGQVIIIDASSGLILQNAWWAEMRAPPCQ